jgi:site-specific recombinase XerC
MIKSWNPLCRPVEFWVGKFEAHILNTCRSGTYLNYSRWLETFLKKFPNKPLAEFKRTHIEDFRWQREKEGTPRWKIMREIFAVHRFFEFLRVHHGMSIPNPAKDATGIRPWTGQAPSRHRHRGGWMKYVVSAAPRKPRQLSLPFPAQ